MSNSQDRLSVFNVPFGTLPLPELAYPGHHARIKRALAQRFNGHTLYSETRLQTALSRAAARRGLFALPLAEQRTRFPYIGNIEDRRWSLDRHWNDLRDAVRMFA
jgi:hypothetical protein